MSLGRRKGESMMKTLEERFYDYAVVPVVVLNDADDAVPLADALIKGGLPCAEVTFRTDAAEESIRRICESFPDMLVGASQRSRLNARTKPEQSL